MAETAPKQEYPKALYDKDGNVRVVTDAEAHANLKGDWREHPHDADDPAAQSADDAGSSTDGEKSKGKKKKNDAE